MTSCIISWRNYFFGTRKSQKIFKKNPNKIRESLFFLNDLMILNEVFEKTVCRIKANHYFIFPCWLFIFDFKEVLLEQIFPKYISYSTYLTCYFNTSKTIIFIFFFSHVIVAKICWYITIVWSFFHLKHKIPISKNYLEPWILYSSLLFF